MAYHPYTPIPKTPYAELHAALGAAIPNLPQSDKTFALSIYDGHTKYGGWSEKQAMWAQKLVDKVADLTKAVTKMTEVNVLTAEGVQALVEAIPPTIDTSAPAVPVIATEGEMASIMGLFKSAAVHLKKPSIKVSVNGLSLGLAPAKKVPENISVFSANSGFGNKFVGTIFPDGHFKTKYGFSDAFTENVTAALKTFAADPAGVAAAHGKLHGKCCFCNKGLVDPKSTSVGYGPVCATHYGLPWGSVPTSSGMAALKSLAKNIVEGKVSIPATFMVPSPSFNTPGSISGKITVSAPDLTPNPVTPMTPKVSMVGDKIMPVLTTEEYERIKARVEVLF